MFTVRRTGMHNSVFFDTIDFSGKNQLLTEIAKITFAKRTELQWYTYASAQSLA